MLLFVLPTSIFLDIINPLGKAFRSASLEGFFMRGEMKNADLARLQKTRQPGECNIWAKRKPGNDYRRDPVPGVSSDRPDTSSGTR